MRGDQRDGEMTRIRAIGEFSSPTHLLQPVLEEFEPSVVTFSEIIQYGTVCFEQLSGQGPVNAPAVQIDRINVSNTCIGPRPQGLVAVELPHHRLSVQVDNVFRARGNDLANEIALISEVVGEL